jgi:hypothetical protein
MPEKFEYPEKGWSTGNMRMAKAGPKGLDPGREYRELEGQRKRKEAEVSEYKALTPEQWANWQQNFPQGQMINKDHPQLAELQNTHDFYSIPNQYEKFLFMNPKQAKQEATEAT